MRDFIDKTKERNGTPINRDIMMALQGFDDIVISFDENSIIETNSKGEIHTTVFESDKIIEVFEGEKKITKTTFFEKNGNIKEQLS